MAKKRLGIDALFQTSVPSAVPEPPAAQASAATSEVGVDLLSPGPGQPRVHFDESSLAELAASIRAHGVLQPILVRPAGGGRYEIVAGERRWRAARAAGLETIPVRVVDVEDRDVLAVAMVENLQREDLNPLEEAEGYLELLRARLDAEAAFAAFADDERPREGVVRLLRALNNRIAGNTKDNVVLTLEPAVAEVFARVGRITWASFVAHRLPLLALPEDVTAALRMRALDYTKARLISRVTAERLGGDDARARAIRRDLVARASTEGLSVRGLQAEIARVLSEERGPATESATVATADQLAARAGEIRAWLDAAEWHRYGDTERDAIAEALDRLIVLMSRAR